MSLDDSPRVRPLDTPRPTNLPGVSFSSAMPDSLVVGGRTVRLRADHRIFPRFEPQVGKTHVLGKVRRAADGTNTAQSWAGAVITGNWTMASGFWKIPAVTKTVMPQGSQKSGWTSSSWVGLDGVTPASNDVLQAGVQQTVDKNGNASYVAWYEWFAPKLDGSPKYVDEVDIPTFNVGPGHEVYCSVEYVGLAWEDNDLTDLGAAKVPLAGSALDGYWGADGISQHVNFVGSDGHLHEMYTNTQIGHWEDNDLTTLSGGGIQPIRGSALHGYVGTDGSQHVNFIGTDGHVHEMYTNPQIAHWQNNDLTAAASGPKIGPAPGTALDGYWGSDNSQHVNFIGTDGHVHEMYIKPQLGHWENNDLTAAASGPKIGPAPGSALDGYWGSDNSQHVNFIGTDGHVHELYIKPQLGHWENNDLTAAANATGPAKGSALDGYWGSDASQHVNFIGTDGNVHELYTNPQVGHWEDNDLTTLSGGGIQPVVGSALSAYWRGDNSQHVNFIGTDGHVHEMYTNPQIARRQNNDLTGFAGSTGTSPAAGSPLDSYWGSDGTQHVNFIGTDGHLREMYTRTF